MTLAAAEQRRLARIEGALRRSDPKLTAMLSMFNRLTWSEAMPRRELLSTPRRRRSFTDPIRHGGPIRLGASAGLAGPKRFGRSRVPDRIAGILPVVIAVCALVVTVMVFSVLSRSRPAGATRGRAASCHSVTLAGCQSNGPTPPPLK